MQEAPLLIPCPPAPTGPAPTSGWLRSGTAWPDLCPSHHRDSPWTLVGSQTGPCTQRARRNRRRRQASPDRCSPYTPQPGLGLSRGLLEVRDDSSTRSEPLTTNRANQSRRNGYRECQGTLCPCQRCGSPGLLWLGLTLLGALQTQAQASTPNLIPAPPLLKVPLQQDFQDDQFQGKWYVVGLAGNAVSKEEQGKFKMYSTTYQLKEDHSYNVTSILFRDQNCDYFIRTFVPSFQPGQFSLGNIKAYPEVQSYTVRVVATNYHQFAMVFFKKVSKNKEYFKITLYGRTKELTPELKEDFVRFTKSLGLTDDHILFPVPIDKCIDD